MPDERRVVTILFADVTGSTSMGERLDPEDLRALLGRYYAIAKEVVSAHGGTVEKFIGDAVMAVFGLRRAHGDDAVRAISAALELRDRVRGDTRLGERMPIRLGVNTGDVVASRDVGSEDFLVTGDAVNVAARLQQNAPPWSVVAGERTVRAARSEFRFGTPLDVDARGKSERLAASEVLGRAHAMSNRTPIFGRDADLAQLELVARRAFDERRPFLVTVIAPAGTGKTRLLEEFLSRLPAVDDSARVAVAQCLPYGQRLTFWPLRAVLYRIIGIDDDAPPDEVRGAIDLWLTSAGVEDADAVGSLLASSVGAADVEIADRAALFGAWRTFIETASRQTPLVIAVEDLHWSSDTLLDLFEFVLQPRADTRAMLIALARPELLDRRPGWGGGRRNHVSISLEPLDDRSTAMLVQNLAEGATPAFVDAIVARAEGNPFFAGEIVAALLGGGLTAFDDPVQIEAALARLPDTVQATVLARLDALPDDEREVLRVGSVFGRTFRPPAVAALLARDTGGTTALADACERLSERDLVRPSGADGYTFRHILIREVAYSTLPRSARAALHGAAGRWLAERAAGREEALAELVAYHFREAATLAGALELDDADSLRDSARTWLVKAAEIARSAAASVEARQHALAAIDFAVDDVMPDVWELVGDVEIGGGPIIAAYEKALAHARRLGRPPAQVLRLYAKLLMVEMRSQGAVASRRSESDIVRMRGEARALLKDVADPYPRALFLAAEGFFPFWLRREPGRQVERELSLAEESASESARLARELDDANLLSAALDALGALAQDRGNWQITLELAEQRIGMGARLGMTEQIDAYAVSAWAAIILGKLELADRLSAAGLAVIQPGQAPDWTIHLMAWRLVALLLSGKWDEAATLAERAERIWSEVGRPAAGYAMRGFVAAIIVARQRRDVTLEQHQTAALTELASSFLDHPRYKETAAIARGDVDAIAEAAGATLLSPLYETTQMAISICNDAGGFDDEALDGAVEWARRYHAPGLEAELLRGAGLVRRDRAALVKAHELYSNSGSRPYAARTRAEIALIDRDRSELDDALAYLESIGDIVQVERYERSWSTVKRKK